MPHGSFQLVPWVPRVPSSEFELGDGFHLLLVAGAMVLLVALELHLAEMVKLGKLTLKFSSYICFHLLFCSKWDINQVILVNLGMMNVFDK